MPTVTTPRVSSRPRDSRMRRGFPAVLLRICVVLTLPLATSVLAADPPCPAAQGWHLSPDDTVDVFTIDRTVVRGIYPIAVSSESLLKIWPIDSLDLAQRSQQPAFGGFVTARRRVFSNDYYLIPLSSIDSIVYRQTSPKRPLILLAGFSGGVVSGAVLGAVSAPQSESLDFPELTYGLVGAIVGGLIGGFIADELSKDMRSTTTLRCR